MKTLKKLSVILAFACTLFAAGCSDIDVRPSGGGDDDDDPIIIITPPKSSSTTVSADTVAIGG